MRKTTLKEPRHLKIYFRFKTKWVYITWTTPPTDTHTPYLI